MKFIAVLSAFVCAFLTSASEVNNIFTYEMCLQSCKETYDAYKTCGPFKADESVVLCYKQVWSELKDCIEPIENGFRSVRETKFNNATKCFSSKRTLTKSINTVRRQANVSMEGAFCALAYWDGSVLEVLSRFAENANFKRDIMAVHSIFNVPRIIRLVMISYDPPVVQQTTESTVDSFAFSERRNVWSGNNSSEEYAVKQDKSHRVNLNSRGPPRLSPLAQPVGASSSTNANTAELLSKPNKFTRFSTEIDRRILLSQSMDVMSRNDLLRSREMELWRTIQLEKKEGR